jgi:hypothetical protein
MLHKYVLEEYLVENYLCPECHSVMTSGIQEPTGDYDDWMIHPHCSECDFSTWGDKNPFDECIPVEKPEAVGLVKMTLANDKVEYLICPVSKLSEKHDIVFWGRGGRMYEGATFEPVQNVAIEINDNETVDDFENRCAKFAKSYVPCNCGSGEPNTDCKANSEYCG